MADHATRQDDDRTHGDRVPHAARHLVPISDAVLDVEVRGFREPLVLIQTALFADEFVPLANHPDLREDYRVVLYHRRGYGRSSPVHGPGSIERDARDCLELLDALGIDRVHVLGGSYAGAVALQLAASAPDRVHSLCLVEPPPLLGEGNPDFVAACEELVESFEAEGPRTAVDGFLSRLVGPQWRHDLERDLPGGVPVVEHDAASFFGADVPALIAWRFSQADAGQVTQPVLYVGGTASGRWFEEAHRVVTTWWPRAESVLVPGAGHSLALTHTEALATALAGFLRRHPVGS